MSFIVLDLWQSIYIWVFFCSHGYILDSKFTTLLLVNTPPNLAIIRVLYNFDCRHFGQGTWQRSMYNNKYWHFSIGVIFFIDINWVSRFWTMMILFSELILDRILLDNLVLKPNPPDLGIYYAPYPAEGRASPKAMYGRGWVGCICIFFCFLYKT